MHPQAGMDTHLVVVADGTRARFMSLEASHDPRSTRRLVERLDLVNPEHQIPMHERFSSPRSDSRGHTQGGSYTLDDHRARQDAEHERRFAAQVTSAVARLVQETGATHLTVIAAPKMLGILRSEGANLARPGLEVTEHASELSRLSLNDIQAHLEKAELLPPSGRARS